MVDGWLLPREAGCLPFNHLNEQLKTDNSNETQHTQGDP